MVLTETLQELHRTSDQITYYDNLKKIGYLLIPVIVGIVLVLHAKNKIKVLIIRKSTIIRKIESELRTAFFGISDSYSSIFESNTYLVYQKKSEFLGKCEMYLLNISDLNQDRELFTVELKKFFSDSYQIVENQGNTIKAYNENFVKKRIAEYETLFQKSPYPLDENQKRAVIVDDKHNLVVAGAGSGKTEVLITRIAYLISRTPDTVQPERILALAFQSKAAQEMKSRLLERYGFDVKIKTFHALGWEILQKGFEKSPQLMFSGDSFEIQYTRYISKIFNELKETPDLQKDILRYIIFFGENYVIREETDFSKKAEYYQYISNLSYTAINGVKVKSEAERTILNFLLTHTINGKPIRVKYESPATWIKYLDRHGKEKNPRPDFFLTDFNIYIEHWAIDKNGNVPSWFSGVNSSKNYLDHMNQKQSHFAGQNLYSLLETFHWEFLEPLFLEKFQQRLITSLKKKFPKREFIIEELYSDALIEQVWRESKESIDDLSKNSAQFITIAKTYHLTPEDIRNRLINEQWTGRQKAFATIAVKIYDRYQADLKSKNCIDFADMINLAISELRNQDNLYKNVFDHILIDEYQDISTQRSDLIKALMNKNEGCKLFCVGDDWQSIMGFTGSSLDFFVNFENYFDHPARTDLTVNYRSCKSIVDLGAAIIKHNGNAQIKKTTIACNPTQRQITVYSSTFDSFNWKKYYEQMMEHCANRADEYLKKGYRPDDILILARINKPNVIRGNLLGFAKARGIPISTEYNNPNKIHLMTVHRSKGLQARVVFILDVVKGLYGFPCEIENPDIYAPAIIGPRRQREEEERRIFYVAATRAKEDLIMYTQKNATSVFLREINEHVVNKEL